MQTLFLSVWYQIAQRITFINSKLCKTLGVIYLNEIKNCDLSKGHSKRANVIFSDSENQDTKKKHFAFGFSTQSVSDFEQIAFEKNENSTCNIF